MLFHNEYCPLKVDVEGLNIAVFPSLSEDATTTDASEPKPKGKSKSKAKQEGKELIVDAHLRFKAGVHYGLLGRNGTGKSSIFSLFTCKICYVGLCQ